MKWIYILKCENNIYYVGETIALYTRFWEHFDGEGGVNTSKYKPITIVAIYKVDTIMKFIEYNEKINNILEDEDLKFNYSQGFNNPKYILNNWEEIYYSNDEEYNKEGARYGENNIAECLMIHNKEQWKNIRGGKYTRFDIEYKYPDNKYIKDLPLCYCGLPCDIKKNKSGNYLFFRCAKKNMFDDFKCEFEIEEEPCKFFKQYIKDEKLKQNDVIEFNNRKQLLQELFKKSDWLNNVEIYNTNQVNNLYSFIVNTINNITNNNTNNCIGGCNKKDFKRITYNNKLRNLCYDCFINKNEELEKKYNIIAIDNFEKIDFNNLLK